MSKIGKKGGQKSAKRGPQFYRDLQAKGVKTRLQNKAKTGKY